MWVTVPRSARSRTRRPATSTHAGSTASLTIREALDSKQINRVVSLPLMHIGSLDVVVHWNIIAVHVHQLASMQQDLYKSYERCKIMPT